MKLKSVSDPEFRKYGRVVKGYDCSELIQAMQTTPLPGGVVYEPSDARLESLAIFSELRNREFGGLPIQLGYCNGHNTMLNAVEYHRSSELNIAATDAVFLVGCQQDIDPDNFTYDTSKIEAFLVPAGTMAEVYATTLHFAPCNADNNGFRVVVVLPAGTNLPLETKQEQLEDRLLFARNKWLIAHPDTDLGAQGAFVGLVGKNRSVEE